MSSQNIKDKRVSSLPERLLQASLRTGFIYCVWIIAFASLLQLGSILPDNGLLSRFTIPLSVLFLIVSASLTTAFFMVYEERSMEEAPKIRYFLLLFTVILGAGLFFFVRKTGRTDNIIFIIGTVNLVVFASILGTWIVAPLKRPAELVPVCLVMSLTDLYSVLGGPTKEMVEEVKTYYTGGMEGQTPAVDFLIVKTAVPNLENLLPVFGVSDWIVVAFLSAGAVKFGMNDNLFGRGLGRMMRERRLSAYFPIASLGLTVAVFSAQFTGVPLPALPIIVLFFLSYVLVRYPRVRMLKTTDWVLALAFSGGIIGMLAVIRYVF